MEHGDTTRQTGEARCKSCAIWGKCEEREHTGAHRDQGKEGVGVYKCRGQRKEGLLQWARRPEQSSL